MIIEGQIFIKRSPVGAEQRFNHKSDGPCENQWLAQPLVYFRSAQRIDQGSLWGDNSL